MSKTPVDASKTGSTLQRWTLWRWPDNDSKWRWLVDLPSADIPSGAVDVTPVMPVAEAEAIITAARDNCDQWAREWERLRAAAQAVVDVEPDRFPSRCWRELAALRAALAPADLSKLAFERTTRNYPAEDLCAPVHDDEEA